MTRRCLAAGYTSVSKPPPPPAGSLELLLLTSGVSPGGVWHYTVAAGWVLKNTGLPTGKYWQWVSANPFNANEWLLLGESAPNTAMSGPTVVTLGTSWFMGDGTTRPVWYTSDAGLHWNEVLVRVPTPLTGTDISGPYTFPYIAWQPTRIEWSKSTNGKWMMVGGGMATASSSRDVLTQNANIGYVRGVRADLAAGVYTAISQLFPLTGYLTGGFLIYDADFAPSTNDEIGFSASDIRGGTGRTFSGEITTVARLPAPANNAFYTVHLDSAPTGRGLVGVLASVTSPYTLGTLITTTNDTTVDLSIANSYPVVTVGTAITQAADGVYVGGRSGGVLRFPGTSAYTHSGSSVVAATAASAIGFIRSDRQTRTKVAAVVSPSGFVGTCWVYDGTNWALQTGPTTPGGLKNYVEVLSR